MSFIVDASPAIDIVLSWLFADEASDETDELGERMVADGALAPGLLFREVTNALMVAQRRGRLSPSDPAMLLSAIASLNIELDGCSPRDMFSQILRLGTEHGLSAYDAAYLDLARHANLPLATLNARLREAGQKDGLAVLP